MIAGLPSVRTIVPLGLRETGDAYRWVLFDRLTCFRRPSASAAAETRAALVVGNDVYEHLPSDRQLHNAVNDARAVKAALESLGFNVIAKEDVRRADFVDALSDFAARIGKDDIAFFVYAGHGVSLNGADYILPTDISAPRGSGRDEEARLAVNAVPETPVIARIRGARVTLIVLDGSRTHRDPAGRARRIFRLARTLPP